ncbi:hypothetical protein XENTR_v90010103mg, partial [Pelobates cultripes]
FFLLGFKNPPILNTILFILFILIYFLTVALNVLIISLVATVPILKSPMYFFLSHLSASDILVTTNITPNMLHVILHVESTISLTGCITQFHFHCLSSAAECLFLTVMSYDRYLAICKPLHYTSIMDSSLCLQLAVWSWILSFSVSLLIAFLIHQLVFCGHVIDHYFCDFVPLLQLSCSDSTIVKMTNIVLSIPLMILPLSFIFYTYISIFITISRISTSSGKLKSFYTCSSHLIVVSIYYGILIAIYMTPSINSSFNANKAISLLFTMGTPIFNPIIYCLRNKDIKKAMRKFL